MSEIREYLDNLPDVSFIEDSTLGQIQQEMVNDYLAKYYQLTGENITLATADPIRVILYAMAAQIYQMYMYIENAGQMGLLKYSEMGYLDNIGALKGIKRNPATPATVLVRFSVAEAMPEAVPIAAGVRVTNDNAVYFYTNNYTEIAAGSLYVDAKCTCTEPGTQGNDFEIGTLDTLVDSVEYISEVSNITVSAGGADIESDASFSERIYLAPAAYSVAGPSDAYAYWCQTFDSNIADAHVTSPTPRNVKIYILMEGGELPSEDECANLQNYLSDRTIRPLTDVVTVSAPEAMTFDIDVTYYINTSDTADAETIQKNVSDAVDEYIEWQTTSIGRDINPSKLTELMMAAGAKRVEVTSPVFTITGENYVAVLDSESVTYGGLEDD